MYNNLLYHDVIILEDYPYWRTLDEEIASTLHEKCWRISVMPVRDLRTEFKKILCSITTRNINDLQCVRMLIYYP